MPKQPLWFVPLMLAGCAVEGAAPPSGPPTTPTTTAAPLDAGALIARGGRADAVFVGEVRRIAHAMSRATATDPALPFTFVTWQVETGLRGVDDGAELTLRFLGGPMPDGRELIGAEMPTFQVGDRDLVFATRNGEVGCPLVDGADGRLQLLRADEAADDASPAVAAEAMTETVLDAMAALPAAPRARSADPAVEFTFTFPRMSSTQPPRGSR
jgi:hypothetical protein